MTDQDEIRSELKRIEEAAKWSSQGQFEQAKIWSAVHLWLAVPAALLAAITGGGLLADELSASVAGILALVSAGLGGAVTALGASEKSSSCREAGNSYLALQGEARRTRNIDLNSQSFEDSRSNLSRITKRQDLINASAEVISKLAYKRARKNIDEVGSQDYEVDRG